MAVFFWRRATAAGGVASILGGMLITVVWEILNKVQGGFPLGLPSIYPALVGSIILLVGVSLITPRPEPAKWQPFTR
jgi:SSS family solute:Na+ symporter/sodium/proline symporter